MKTSVLPAPSAAVLGAQEIGGLAAFLGVFGGQPRRLPALSAEAAGQLYGIDAPLEQVLIEEPGSAGTLRLVRTPNAAVPFQPLQEGPYGVDYYSRDIELSLSMLRAAGGSTTSRLVGYSGDPAFHTPEETGHITHELMVVGPEELRLFLTDVRRTTNPWPTLLSTDSARTHSELLQVVWVVADIEAELAFWRDEVGMIVVLDEIPELEEMQDLMFTPRSSPLRCVHVTDAVGHHKIELLSYPDETLVPYPHGEIRGGLHSVAFDVHDLEATLRLLPSATFGPVVTADQGRGPQRVVSALSPSGSVRFELWEV
ncbi:MAG: VOC family protein [Nocardioidaceae bacterium]|nr:VOC family protein [Nocardioidaceae bacterium]